MILLTDVLERSKISVVRGLTLVALRHVKSSRAHQLQEDKSGMTLGAGPWGESRLDAKVSALVDLQLE